MRLPFGAVEPCGRLKSLLEGNEEEARVSDRLVVACVQQKMRLPLTTDEYREELRRFLRVAAGKQARLVVFPQMGGVMAAPPILRDFRSQLLKQADRGARRQASLWQRALGAMAGLAAGLVRADFRSGLVALLDVAGADLWQATQETFGGLAREFGITLVAPSAYLPDPVDGVIRELTCVFGNNGELLGRQAKVVAAAEDQGLAQPGTTWDVIATEVGRLGIILGNDVLYPEVGRLLAYQGADALVVQAACADALHYNKIRAGTLARMQDNQVFAVLSCMVGVNRLGRGAVKAYVGKSAIFAPQELTPRENGVLVEMGTARAEGVLAAPWEYAALRRLWETSATPLRRQLPVQQAGQMLAQLYARLQGLPAPDHAAQAAVEDTQAAMTAITSSPSKSTLQLEDLAVIGSVTHVWPSLADAAVAGEVVVDAAVAGELDLSSATDLDDGVSAKELQRPVSDKPALTEDETDEMDAVDGEPGRAVQRGDQAT